MSYIDLIETTESFVVRIANQEVTRCSVDYAVTLVVGSGAGAFYVTIEQPFWFRAHDAGSEAWFIPEREPEKLGPVLSLLHRPVEQIVARRDGELELWLGGRAVLSAPATEEFEAWNIVGPDGMRFVAMPGGDLAVWKPHGV